MTEIKTTQQYSAACERIEELLKLVDNNTPPNDDNFVELNMISNLVVDYEEHHHPINTDK